MAKIPIYKGIYTDKNGDYRTRYPQNYYVVEKDTGIEVGYLYPTPGIKSLGLIEPGVSEGFNSRGGQFNSRMRCQFRVMGNGFYEIRSPTEFIRRGTVPGVGRVAMTHSFNSQLVVTNTRAFRWDGTNFTRITDRDLGVVFDGAWVDGYYVMTDGENIVLTDLDDETSVQVLRFGSSEVFPDRINGIGIVQNEIVAFNRYTTEVFTNRGGTGFPFIRVESAMQPIGLVGTHAKVTYGGGYALIGGGLNENISVWFYDGQVRKLATREIETLLADFTEAQLARATMDSYSDQTCNFLKVNLPGLELVYDITTSDKLGINAWHTRTPNNSLHPVHANGVWWVADNNGSIGQFDHSLGSEWGEPVDRRIESTFVFDDRRDFIINSLELQGTFGRTRSLTANPVVRISYTDDGELYSNEKPLNTGKRGDRQKRFVRRRLGKTRQTRAWRIRSVNDSRISISRLDVDMEVLES